MSNKKAKIIERRPVTSQKLHFCDTREEAVSVNEFHVQ